MKKITTLATVAIIMFLTSFCASAQRGYRGFIDAIAGYGILDDVTWDESYSCFSGGVSTVHGYQMGNWFVGGGLSFFALSEVEESPCLPIFVQGRYDYSLISSKSFFALAKCGYDPLVNSVYAGFGGGIRIALNRGISALNIGLNFSVHEEESYYAYNEKNIIYLPFLTFGIEF